MELHSSRGSDGSAQTGLSHRQRRPEQKSPGFFIDLGLGGWRSRRSRRGKVLKPNEEKYLRGYHSPNYHHQIRRLSEGKCTDWKPVMVTFEQKGEIVMIIGSEVPLKH